MFIRNYPLAKATSLGVGGPADYFARPATEAELISALQFAEQHDLNVIVLGYGTNVLVRSAGIRGLVIQMADNFAHVQVDGTTITASAGCLFSAVSKLAAYHRLTGLEFAVGIPGGIGGAVFMNAGAYDGEIGPLSAACILPLRLVLVHGPVMSFLPVPPQPCSARKDRSHQSGAGTAPGQQRRDPGQNERSPGEEGGPDSR